MALEFREVVFSIPNGTGERQFDQTLTFDSRVIQASASINSFRFAYANKDHHIDTIMIDTETIPIRNQVRLLVRTRYEDKNADDRYNGLIVMALIVEHE